MREPPFKPFALGRYRCEERLRAGGIGDLYLALHLPTGSRCTLWKVCPEVLDDPELAEQLLQVQLRVQAINHPNITPVREVLRKDSDIFVAMEYQPGVSLRQVLLRLRETGPLSPPVASFVVWQICQALDHVHHLKHDGRPAPLIHGALWPQNVTVGTKGNVRLVDFGTWLIPRAAYQDEEGSVRTDFSYRAPEHVNGEALTRATDIFCMGILLYEMVTARPLFLAPTLMETVRRVEQADLGTMAEVPPSLQRVLRRCLAAQPRDRYADVAAFIAELSLVVVGVGDRAVRQELVRFIAGNFALREIDKPRPAPLPGQEDDETTDISPTDLTEVLRALSRERTEPGRLGASAPDGGELVAEPTRVDSRLPGLLGDAGTDTDEPSDDLPTSVQAAPEALPDYDSAAGTAPGHRPPPGLFPPRELGEEETTFTRSTGDTAEDASTLRVSPHALAAAVEDEIPTLNETPRGIEALMRAREPAGSEAPSPQQPAAPAAGRWPAAPPRRDPTQREVVDAARAPTLMDAAMEVSPRPSPGLTGPAPTLRSRPARGLPAASRSDEPPDQLSSLAPVGPAAGLFLDGTGASERSEAPPAPVTFEPNDGTPLSAFDPDAFSLSYSQSYEANRRRSRLSTAHIMLGVAVLVFLVAVTMLVRRLISRPAAVPRPVAVDARAPEPDSRRRPDATRPDLGQEAVRSSGGAYGDLLKGRLPPGRLRVESEPAGARLFLGGRPRGLTPLTARLRPGHKVDLVLVANGYLLLRRQVTLPKGRGLRLAEKLVKADYPRRAPPRAGLLRVRCRDAQQRRIFVDEEDTGLACGRVELRLRAGVHKVSLYSVERDKQVTYRVRLKSRKISWLVVKGDRRLR